MSVKPVNQQEGSVKRGSGGGFSRQGSFGSSEDESYSGQHNFRRSQDQLSNSCNRKSESTACSKIVQNIYFQIFITLLTVITLLFYDIKTIVFSKNEDFAIGVANCIFCAIFLAEIGMNIKTEGYFCSFFFFLDLVSTITILFDVDFITDAMFNQSSSFNVSSFVAKSKTSRVAARAVRVVKIFRLARVAKLYKSTQKAKQLNEKERLAILEKESKRVWNHGSNQYENIGGNNDEPSNHNLVSRSYITRKNLNTSSNIQRYDLENDSIKQEPIPSPHYNPDKTENILPPHLKNSFENLSFVAEPSSDPPSASVFQSKQSQISKILTQDTIKKIVIIILLIMMEIPLLSISNFEGISTQWDYTSVFIANALINPNISLPAVQQLLQRQINAFPESAVVADFICLDSPFLELSSCMEVDFQEFRSADLGVFSQWVNVSAALLVKPSLTLHSTLKSQNSGDSISIFVNYSRYNSMDAGFSIATTTFICLTIVYLLSSFSTNINDLIIIPIERMLRLVRVEGQGQGDVEAEVEEDEEEYETKLVQQAIVKIKDLMETIYGPLGNNLVQKHMLNNKSISTNLMNSLRDSLCVATLCKLSHITKLTQLLGEDAFGLINQIAFIVHNAAFRYGGYCTKVLDQGFLIIFKVNAAQLRRFGIDQETDLQQLAKKDRIVANYLNNFCDFALFFALKTLARIVKEPKLFKYRSNQNLLRGFGGVFNIQMNFAFTLGWCSEAVIGSSHKIDPLFLGEEVNQLARTIRISQNYPSSILIAESLHRHLSPGLLPHIRPFDVVKFQEDREQIRLYFVDYDPTNVSPSLNLTQKNRKEAKDLRTKKAMNMLYLSGALKGDKAYNATSFVARKKELSQILRKSKDDTRRKRYQEAFENYLKGSWPLCQQFLQNETVKNDIPSQRLFSFLQAHSFNAPENWKGYRLYQHLAHP